MMDTPDATIGPMNLGNPSEKTVLELAAMVREMTGSTSAILLEPLPKDDPCRRRPDISQAKRALAWSPVVDLETGLTRTIEYFKSILGNSQACLNSGELPGVSQFWGTPRRVSMPGSPRLKNERINADSSEEA
jgi:UDP-glucuronate decarboxylase